MKCRTTHFGEIDYSSNVALRFPCGIPGFPDAKRFILLESDADGSPFKWLQSLDDADLVFPVIDPALVQPGYQYQIDQDSAQVIGTQDPAECAVLCILSVPHENPAQVTANLKAPLVINADRRIGRQIILGSNSWCIHTPVFSAQQLETHREAQVQVGQPAYRVG